MRFTRREVLGFAASSPLATASRTDAGAAAVSIGRAHSYTEDLGAVLSRMFDQLGGLGRLVRGKTVTLKLNLTGSPGLRYQGKPLGVTHYVHPAVVGQVVYLLGRAGAGRIRLVESCWASGGPLEEYLLDSGWNVRSLATAASGVEFENTNNLGKGKRYARLKTPGHAYMYPAYDLNHSYEETDVFFSLAKLKQHATCGLTLSLKNLFGITPAAIYGDDAGVDQPNEKPSKGRLECLHAARRKISKCAPQELNASPSHDPGYRVPHIVAELAAARPIHLALIDGIESLSGGEGPWIEGVRAVQPGLLVAGLDPVATDAVSASLMGFDPAASRGTPPFAACDNIIKLAEALGAGTADLKRIDVRGISIAHAKYPFA
jgi:uncharacterized protein (DUF362 family)